MYRRRRRVHLLDRGERDLREATVMWHIGWFLALALAYVAFVLTSW
jgi:hypothetical protein